MDSYCKSLIKLENQLVIFEKEQEHYEEDLLAKDLLIKSQTNKIRELNEQAQRLTTDLNLERKKLDLFLIQWEETSSEMRHNLQQTNKSYLHYRKKAHFLKETNHDLIMEMATLKEKNEMMTELLRIRLNPDPNIPKIAPHENIMQNETRGVPLGTDPDATATESIKNEDCEDFDSFHQPVMDEDLLLQKELELELASEFPVFNGVTPYCSESTKLLTDAMLQKYDEKFRKLIKENEQLRKLIQYKDRFRHFFTRSPLTPLTPISACSSATSVAGLHSKWDPPKSSSPTSFLFFFPSSTVEQIESTCPLTVD